MGFGAANLLGTGSAMNAVAGAVKADPNDTDWVIGPGRDYELVTYLAGLGGLRENGWVESVVGVGRDDGDVKFADGAFFDEPGDAAREMSEEIGGGVKGFKGLCGEMDSHEGSLGRRFGISGVGDGENETGRHVAPIHGRIEAANEVGV